MVKRNLLNGIILTLVCGFPFVTANAMNPQPGMSKASPVFDVITPAGKKMKAKRAGNMLYLVGEDGKGLVGEDGKGLVGEDGKHRVAPDGRYRLSNGQYLTVSNKRIVASQSGLSSKKHLPGTSATQKLK